MPDASERIVLVGAGLAGSLLAVLMARNGQAVSLYERYPDPRQQTVPAGRSINLALAERGRMALARAELLDTVEDFALPMVGRRLHDEQGQTQLQKYGQRDDEVIWSVHRGHLNQALLNAAEAHGVNIHFGHRLDKADFDRRCLYFSDPDGNTLPVDFDLVIGSDGAGSALRKAMNAVSPLGIREEPLGHGYLELTIPPGPDGGFQMDPQALHIWPRGGYMMIALPNPDRSFTCTLFLQNQGEPGFDQLAAPSDMRAFLQQAFPDAVALMPDLDRELAEHPVGFLGTLYVDQWQLDDCAVILGDAAHAIVPFHGQGMNAAFEDTVALADRLASQSDRHQALADFQRDRKPNADAIAAMALDNYLEMRDRVRDPRFHLKKQLEWALEARLPGEFIPRYQMVMFHAEIPYAEALARGERQAALLDQLTENRQRLDEIDLDHACQQARQTLHQA
ncbi:MAG: FAD-dependent oxidoreductase [Wenzhouxiangella sp.]